MLKGLVIDRCEYCDGEAYIYAGEYKDEFGEHPVYRPCTVCKGSGEMEKQVTLREFVDLLDRTTAMEPDWEKNHQLSKPGWKQRDKFNWSRLPGLICFAMVACARQKSMNTAGWMKMEKL